MQTTSNNGALWFNGASSTWNLSAGATQSALANDWQTNAAFWSQADLKVWGNIKSNASVEAKSDGYFYMGDPDTNGTWRIGRSGDNLVMQRRESGTYVTKSTITP